MKTFQNRLSLKLGVITLRGALRADIEGEILAALRAAKAEIEQIESREELLAYRQKHLGDSAWLALYSRQLKELEAELRPKAGAAVARARRELGEAFRWHSDRVELQERKRQYTRETVDVSAFSPVESMGSRHPLSLLLERMVDIFVAEGWCAEEGPELESEWYNFDALNIDPDHPSRSPADTFFIEPEISHRVLRTQTSPMQIRALLDRPLPLYLVSPGRVFRSDSLDATHTPVFHQLEGIAVDRELNLGHMRGVIERLARELFGAETRMRLRCNYFPFTEPSAEFDVWHPGLPGGPRWVEWGGCGLVNRRVLASAGVDADEFRGFAFGLGLERTLQFAYGLSDMRDMVEGDMRFSRQFPMGF